MGLTKFGVWKFWLNKIRVKQDVATRSRKKDMSVAQNVKIR